MSKLQLSDLLNTLTTPQVVVSTTTKSKPTKHLQQFIHNKSMKVKQIKKSQQSRMKKSMNYKATQQDMDKWIGIVKVNREKQTLDLTNKQRTNVNINFFPSKPVSALQQKTDSLLKQLSMQNSATIMKAEQQQLDKLDPQEAKRRLVQARKHRTMIFHQQIKRRRISKIKSKVYHKIKKRQRQRDQQKRVQTMSPHEKSQYMQKLMKNRIQQRISLRHNSKNKHIQNLLRFSKYNKDGVQQAMNEVNLIRQKQLQRGDKLDQQLLGDIQEEYDDENYRQQAIGQLERELARMQQQQQQDGQQNIVKTAKKQGLQGMKFMQVARAKQQQKDIDDAYKLINQLKDQQSGDMEIDDQDYQDSNQERNNNNTNKNNKNRPTTTNNSQQVTRKLYGQTIQQKHHKQQQKQLLLLNSKKQFIKKNINQSIMLGDNVQQLTKGLDIQRLKDKYQPQRVQLRLNQQQLIQINRQVMLNGGVVDGQNNGNEAVLENLRQFQHDRIESYQKAIQPENKRVQGWGAWAGPSIKLPKIDPQQQIRKKLAKIQQIKRKRKDGELTNVIIHQVRNKQLKDYMVQKLPHQYNNVEQFEYMNQAELGPEWNSLTQFKANIKPKVITRVGEVIEPIRAPKRMGKV